MAYFTYDKFIVKQVHIDVIPMLFVEMPGRSDGGMAVPKQYGTVRIAFDCQNAGPVECCA